MLSPSPSFRVKLEQRNNNLIIAGAVEKEDASHSLPSKPESSESRYELVVLKHK